MATAAEPALGLKDGEILTAWPQGQANIRKDVAGVDPVVEMFTQMLNRIGPGAQIRDERRFESMMLGVGADLKRRAWSEALKLARAN